MRAAAAAGWLAAMHDSSKEHIVWAGRALAYLVYFFVTVALIVLTFGFFLLLFGANPDAAFAEWVYRRSSVSWRRSAGCSSRSSSTASRSSTSRCCSR